jgi:hypothetical protein
MGQGGKRFLFYHFKFAGEDPEPLYRTIIDVSQADAGSTGLNIFVADDRVDPAHAFDNRTYFVRNVDCDSHAVCFRESTSAEEKK